MKIYQDLGTILISGPARSGKSEWAENIIKYSKKDIVYQATHINNNEDESWIKRIRKHRERRPSEWKLIESADITKVISGLNSNNSLLIDSLGGVIAEYINFSSRNWQIYSDTIIDSLSKFNGLVVIVAEETGWGVSPTTKVGNIFRDRLGKLTQDIEHISKDSWLVFRGRAINLKSNSVSINSND